MARVKGRGHRVAVDFRCHGHDRRMGLVWVDRRRPGVLCSRLPGGGSLPGGWCTAVLECGICGLGVEIDCGRTCQWLTHRGATIGPSTFVWLVRADDPPTVLARVRVSSRAISGVAAGSGAPARAVREIPSPSDFA